MDYITAYNILRTDNKVPSEVEKYLRKNNVVIFEGNDYEYNFDHYMTMLYGDLEEDDFNKSVAEARHMIETGEPITDWGVVQYNGERFYIMYIIGG